MGGSRSCTCQGDYSLQSRHAKEREYTAQARHRPSSAGDPQRQTPYLPTCTALGNLPKDLSHNVPAAELLLNPKWIPSNYS